MYLWPNSLIVPEYKPCEVACLRGLTLLAEWSIYTDAVQPFQHFAVATTVYMLSSKTFSSCFMSLSRELNFQSLQSFIPSTNLGLVPREYLTAIYNSVFLDKDIFSFNPEQELHGDTVMEALFSLLPLFFIQLIARLSSCGVLRLVLRLVQLRVTSASLAPVGGGFPATTCSLWWTGAGSSNVGEGFRWFAGSPLRVPAGQSREIIQKHIC